MAYNRTTPNEDHKSPTPHQSAIAARTVDRYLAMILEALAGIEEVAPEAQLHSPRYRLGEIMGRLLGAPSCLGRYLTSGGTHASDHPNPNTTTTLATDGRRLRRGLAVRRIHEVLSCGHALGTEEIVKVVALVFHEPIKEKTIANALWRGEKAGIYIYRHGKWGLRPAKNEHPIAHGYERDWRHHLLTAIRHVKHTQAPDK